MEISSTARRWSALVVAAVLALGGAAACAKSSDSGSAAKVKV